MPLVPASRQEPPTTQESNNSVVSTLRTRITLMSCPISSPRNMMNDISENPSWSPLFCPASNSHLSFIVPLNVRSTLVSPQESVLLHVYRHERPIAIVRPVLMSPIKSAGNSQGKCGRYKIKLRLPAHWSKVFMALSRVLCAQVRRRIAVTPNDNFSGKLSRFKGLAIERIQTCVPNFSSMP